MKSKHTHRVHNPTPTLTFCITYYNLPHGKVLVLDSDMIGIWWRNHWKLLEFLFYKLPIIALYYFCPNGCRFLLHSLSFRIDRMQYVTRRYVVQTKRPQGMANCSVRENCYFNAAIKLLAAWEVTYSCWNIPYSLFNRLNFEKMVREFVKSIFLNLLCPKTSPNTLIALMAHHTPPLPSTTYVLDWDSQLTSISHFEYLNGRWSKTMIHL